MRGYRGLTGSAGIMYPILEVARINVQAQSRQRILVRHRRGVLHREQPHASATPSGSSATSTRSVTGSKSIFDYGFTERSPARQDKLDSLAGGVGYNLPNRTRISVNYEYARRRSPQIRERNYDRRRAYLAWTFAF